MNEFIEDKDKLEENIRKLLQDFCIKYNVSISDLSADYPFGVLVVNIQIEL